ncbi:TIGR01621 family pseudouridine synthase [Colwellia sp. BRX8-7]|uniref:TIGR01621 family pseudouridine synthase n=1 Tax=Colwellia sp. BRX8-7 TaxID=2759833 RepID=UPI0015F39024|nr:TIGR01621 family pseudouridine synthase [Colwellia sp. BRX8-7]MBA6339006.1 TIGR01621 family pseudouridine synthase [Colwellia sp. BRX8-7]
MQSINIIFEHNNFIIVEKPADVNFHDEGDLEQGFFNQVKKQGKAQGKFDDLFPVHRLDKMTSGLMIFAKNLATTQQFQTLFEQHKVEKYYLAISDKKPKKKQGLIKGDMEKSRRGMWKLLRTQVNPAITQFLSYSLSDGQRLYLLKPRSGKTHQLRVALSSIGSPILGDPLYATQDAYQEQRGYLHAYALSFTLDGEKYQFVLCPSSGEKYLSESCQQQLETIKIPWSLTWPNIS